MVVDGFFNAIHASLNYILDNTDPKTNTLAIFEAKLELQTPDMVFIPSLDYVSGTYGFYDMVESIVNDIYSMATLVARLADHNESSLYQVLFLTTCLGHLLDIQCKPPVINVLVRILKSQRRVQYELLQRKDGNNDVTQFYWWIFCVMQDGR